MNIEFTNELKKLYLLKGEDNLPVLAVSVGNKNRIFIITVYGYHANKLTLPFSDYEIKNKIIFDKPPYEIIISLSTRILDYYKIGEFPKNKEKVDVITPYKIFEGEMEMKNDSGRIKISPTFPIIGAPIVIKRGEDTEFIGIVEEYKNGCAETNPKLLRETLNYFFDL